MGGGGGGGGRHSIIKASTGHAKCALHLGG